MLGFGSRQRSYQTPGGLIIVLTARILLFGVFARFFFFFILFLIIPLEAFTERAYPAAHFARDPADPAHSKKDEDYHENNYQFGWS
jgi:hypothetical protein